MVILSRGKKQLTMKKRIYILLALILSFILYFLTRAREWNFEVLPYEEDCVSFTFNTDFEENPHEMHITGYARQNLLVIFRGYHSEDNRDTVYSYGLRFKEIPKGKVDERLYIHPYSGINESYAIKIIGKEDNLLLSKVKQPSDPRNYIDYYSSLGHLYIHVEVKDKYRK